MLVFGQSHKVSSKLDISVLGTSTLHDWEMISKKGNGVAEITLENGVFKDIKSLDFVMKTNSLKSGKSTMDNICYDAMKVEKYPYIRFVLLDIIKNEKVKDGYKITATGQLTIAGVSKKRTIVVYAKQLNSKIHFTGSHKMKMSDFNVEAPTAMFGAIKTGDEITVKVSVMYEYQEGI